MRRFVVAAIVLLEVLPVRTSQRSGAPQTPGASIDRELARVRSQIRASVPEDERAALLQRLECNEMDFW